MIAYKKKLTAGVGWLRPVTTPQPIMRLTCVIEEGWEESSHLGSYIRWIGKFRAEVAQRDGTLMVYVSRNLIPPAIASDIIAMRFERRQKDDTKIAGRTGGYFSPKKEGSLDETLIFDLWIIPPSGGKQSTTGYEFEIRILKSAESLDMFDELSAGLPNFQDGIMKLTNETERQLSLGVSSPSSVMAGPLVEASDESAEVVPRKPGRNRAV